MALRVRTLPPSRPSTLTSAFSMVIDLGHDMPAHACARRSLWHGCRRCRRDVRGEPADPACLGESHDRVPCGCGAGVRASAPRLRGDSSHSRSRGGSPRWRCWPRTRARGSRRTSRPSSRPTSGSGSSVPVLRAVAQPMARPGLALGTRPAAVAMHGQIRDSADRRET